MADASPDESPSSCAAGSEGPEQWQPGYVTDLCAAGEVDPLIVDSGVLGLGR